MTRRAYLPTAWANVKKWAIPALTAFLFFLGLQQVIHAVSSPVTNLVVIVINGIIQRAFRDVIPLRDLPVFSWHWWYYTKMFAESVIFLTLGMFAGLWVRARQVRHTNESPRRSEGSISV